MRETTGLYSSEESSELEGWMPQIAFDELPGYARVWIFSASRQLNEEERTRLLGEVDAFIDQWGAHGAPLSAGRHLAYEQFLFIAVDQRAAGPSGCSVDALVRTMKVLQDDLGVELVNHAPVLFRQGESIARVPRDAFARLAEEGEVGLDTTVFNNTLTNLGDVRDGRWEVAAGDSWHGRAFF